MSGENFLNRLNAKFGDKVSGGNFQETINFIENQWQIQMPDRPFQFQLMDSQFEKFYHSQLLFFSNFTPEKYVHFNF